MDCRITTRHTLTSHRCRQTGYRRRRSDAMTWMDAKFDGVCFTPATAKRSRSMPCGTTPCAIWQNTTKPTGGQRPFYAELAKQVASFVRVFWNEPLGYLNDCVLPDRTADASLRRIRFCGPLPYSPLGSDKQKKVVATVQREC